MKPHTAIRVQPQRADLYARLGGFNRVTDTSAQTRALVDACGLDWQDSSLRPAHNRRSVITLSSRQVREPVYTRSVSRWRNYRRQLEPLVEALRAP